MEMDLFSCTYENLNNLKFNELQKLSARFHVTKRWAKKREIIDNILSLRDQKIGKNQEPEHEPEPEPEKNDAVQENIKWVDGSKAFASDGIDTNEAVKSGDNNDRRLTYCITTSEPEVTERRLTYKIEKPEQLILNGTDDTNFDRRLTYNADEMKSHNLELKTIVSQNCPTIKENKILEDKKNIKHKPGDKMNMDNNKLSADLNSERKMFSAQAQSKECLDPAPSKVKMLTVPYTRISSYNSARIKGRGLKNNTTKLMENPCNAKKSIGRLSENMKPTEMSKQQAACETVKNNNILKPSSVAEKNMSNISTKSSDNCFKNARNEFEKQGRSVLPRRKSRTEDNVLVKNFKSSKNLVFYSPNESDMKNMRGFSKSNALDLQLTCRSKIPKAKPAVSTQKPIVANKMPDFSKIHQRRFEQMDSLIDYKRKKEERAKKLFGLPQPGIPIKANRSDVTKVFQFKSSHKEKENKLNKSMDSLKKDIVKVNNENKEKPNRKDVLTRAGSKPDIMNNLKEQNRKHLHGVRTNKRFELQMKSRKL